MQKVATLSAADPARLKHAYRTAEATAIIFPAPQWPARPSHRRDGLVGVEDGLTRFRNFGDRIAGRGRRSRMDWDSRRLSNGSPCSEAATDGRRPPQSPLRTRISRIATEKGPPCDPCTPCPTPAAIVRTNVMGHADSASDPTIIPHAIAASRGTRVAATGRPAPVAAQSKPSSVLRLHLCVGFRRKIDCAPFSASLQDACFPDVKAIVCAVLFDCHSEMLKLRGRGGFAGVHGSHGRRA